MRYPSADRSGILTAGLQVPSESALKPSRKCDLHPDAALRDSYEAVALLSFSIVTCDGGAKKLTPAA